MTHRAPILLLVVALSSLMGCTASFVPFTHELRARHGLTESDMQQLQYYVSHDVKLRREAQTIGRNISGGNLKLLEGKTIEEIVINKHTPGVAMAVEKTSIVVSFQEGSELSFSLKTGEPMPLRKTSSGYAEPPNPFPGGDGTRAEPRVSESLGNFWLDSDSDAMVQFQGKHWNGMEDTFRAHLVIDAESLEEVVETRNVLEGRTVAQASVRTIWVR